MLKVLFKRLGRHIKVKRKKQTILLLFLMILASFSEIISIGAVLPFLGVLTAPDFVFEHPALSSFISFMGITSPDGLLLPLVIIFGMAAIFAGLIRLAFVWYSTKLAFFIGADLSFDVYKRTLYQDYEVHIGRNSSEIINVISTKVNSVIYDAVIPILVLINSIIIITSILIFLFFVDPLVVIVVFGGFGSIYLIVTLLVKNKLKDNGDDIAFHSTNIIKILQEGLGGIRNILLDGSQRIFCKKYQNFDILLRHAQSDNAFISQAPRFIIESLGMFLIAILAYTLSLQSEDIGEVIPILGAMAIGAQRLLPLLQQSYSAWSNIQGGRSSLTDVLELLDQKICKYSQNGEMIFFDHGISLVNLSFGYGNKNPMTIKGVDLCISKGECIGFVGPTGSGKSTLLNIIMGLLTPSKKGELLIDSNALSKENKRFWYEKIAHVPQDIFLSDGSIEENIAFGVLKSEIDHERIRDVCRKSQILDTIESFPNKFNTIVGEGGVRLSGGQKQRIGIARALYKEAEILILDEATSALDSNTENLIMKEISKLSENLTILIIAHRVTTLKECSKIISLKEGRIKSIQSYNDFIAKN